MASEHPISINEGGTSMSAQHSIPITKEAIPSQTEAAVSEVAIPQYGLRAILAVWAAAALPMAALAWLVAPALKDQFRSEEHTSELQSRRDLVCRLLLEKK